MFRTVAITTLLLLTGMPARLYPQSPDYGNDSLRCLGSLSVMSEFARMELYDEAYDAWKYCFAHCPAASRNIYIIGANILKNRIENQTEAVTRENAIDTLMLQYDRRMDLFGQSGYVLGRKALDLLAYRPEQAETVYGMLKESVALEQESAEPAVLANLLQLSTVLFRSNAIPSSTVIEDYFTVMHHLSYHPALTGEQRNRVMESLNDVLVRSSASTCGSLQDYLLPKLNAYSSSIAYLKNLVSLMKKMGCMTSDLNLKASTLLFEADPSPEMAQYLAGAFLAAGEPERANDLYVKALDMEENPEVRADIYCQMSLVSQQQGKYLPARELAQQALEIDPALGKAYLAIGLAYAASADQCGENDFERQAIYWAAVDKFAEAGVTDPSVRDQADELIRQYNPYFPDNETAFFYGYNDGELYHVGCWINENTEVRTRKITE